MIYVPWGSGNDVRAGVVGQDRRSGEVEHVHDVVHGFDDVAVADTHALVRRLDGELVPTA